MRTAAKFAQQLILLLALTFSTDVTAQVHIQVNMAGTVDCDQPVAVKNVPIRADVVGVLNRDGSASADVTQTAFFLSTVVHFTGRLGAPPSSAPGGTSQVRVAGRNSLRLMWNLPNNQLVVQIVTRGQSCSAQFSSVLRPGRRQHTLFDGSRYHYCGRPRMAQVSCQAR
jgi:hypothetical protein